MPFAEGWKVGAEPGARAAPQPLAGLPLTCDPAAEELKPQGDAGVPGLGPDPDEPGQQRRVQLVQNHLGGVVVGLEHLERKTGNHP